MRTTDLEAVEHLLVRAAEGGELGLVEQLDELLKDGLRLIDEFPELPKDATQLPIGSDTEWVDRAIDYHGRANDLLRRERPSMLPFFADALDAERKKGREAYAKYEQMRDEIGDRYPQAKAMREFSERVHSRPRAIIEQVFTALSEVRERVESGERR